MTNLEQLSHTLWQMLGNIPVNDVGIIQERFLHFETGTQRENIWHWFEETFPGFSVAHVMYSSQQTTEE